MSWSTPLSIPTMQPHNLISQNWNNQQSTRKDGEESFVTSRHRKWHITQTWHPANLAQMVFCHHGHGDCVYAVAQSALQRSMAVLDLRRDICAQCAPIHGRLFHHYPSTHAVSGGFLSNDQTPSPVNVYGHLSHGTGNNHQHDMCCVCSCMGSESQLSSLWAMDLGRCNISDRSSVIAIHAVRVPFHTHPVPC